MKRILALASCLASFAVLPAAEAPWRIGLATVKITPEDPVLMYGYGGRNDPHQGVTSDLFAKALALEDASGGRAVLVTCDLGGLHGDMVGRIAARLQAKHGLPRAAVLYNASHTHAGPWAWVAREEIDGVSPAAVQSTRAYVAKLEGLLENVATAALAQLEPATLTWGLGMAPFVMNRREFTDRGIILGFNPKGPVDRSVLVLRADDAQGKMRAVLMGVACHCTCSGPKNLQIDGDYAGYAQTEVQARFPGAQAMFLTGCGGDANPWPRGEIAHARQHGATLAAEVARVLAEKLAPVRPPLRTAFQQVALPLAPPGSHEQLAALAKSPSSWLRYIGTRQLALLDRGQQPAASYPVPIAFWHFGTDLALVGLSGEPVNDFVHLIENAVGPTRLWVAGYCHDVFGYVPSARVLAEGGYETRGIDRGDAVGQFTPAAQDVIITAVAALARETGRLK
jgi:neutral ceramidase